MSLGKQLKMVWAFEPLPIMWETWTEVSRSWYQPGTTPAAEVIWGVNMWVEIFSFSGSPSLYLCLSNINLNLSKKDLVLFAWLCFGFMGSQEKFPLSFCLFFPLGMGLSILCMSHYCTLEVGNFFCFHMLTVRGNSASGWTMPRVWPILMRFLTLNLWEWGRSESSLWGCYNGMNAFVCEKDMHFRVRGRMIWFDSTPASPSPWIHVLKT